MLAKDTTVDEKRKSATGKEITYATFLGVFPIGFAVTSWHGRAASTMPKPLINDLVLCLDPPDGIMVLEWNMQLESAGVVERVTTVYPVTLLLYCASVAKLCFPKNARPHGSSQLGCARS